MTAEVDFNPYPHMHIKNIFRPDLYACMLASLPSKDKGVNELYKHMFAKIERYSVQLLDGGFVGPGLAYLLSGGGSKRRDAGYAKLKENDNRLNVPFWSLWARTFGSEEIKLAYMQKMKSTLLTKNPKALTLAPNLHWNMALNRDMTGYEIGPHTDSRGKWVTILYYLAPDANAPKKAGTCMLRSKSGKVQKSSSEWADW
eukprot:CAMPEP_0196575460 /NCGR_PEP_ID=MMETSP1081-20130531/4932_1 /TAXON_ID=36882 /ORGANISM="Pyramimonas amylifera, Strain CCMP720" /LENGTH=199 /DNA_ID=CAMNT_0041893769 /DNA_START=396 /DNA_END=992 /DNA_ORIENTATION=+